MTVSFSCMNLMATKLPVRLAGTRRSVDFASDHSSKEAYLDFLILVSCIFSYSSLIAVLRLIRSALTLWLVADLGLERQTCRRTSQLSLAQFFLELPLCEKMMRTWLGLLMSWSRQLKAGVGEEAESPFCEMRGLRSEIFQ
jgi:hypothetical protein